MNLLGCFDRFMAICDDAGIIISLFILFIYQLSSYKIWRIFIYDLPIHLDVQRNASKIQFEEFKENKGLRKHENNVTLSVSCKLNINNNIML